MATELIIVLALAALVVGYFLFGRKKAQEYTLDEAASQPPTAAPSPRKEQPAKAPEAGGAGPAGAPTVQQPPPEAVSAAAAPPPAPPPRGDISGMRRGLARSREEGGFFGKLRDLLGTKKELSPEIAQEIEEALLSSDVGVNVTKEILARLQEQLDKGALGDSDRVWDALREEAARILDVEGRAGGIRLGTKPTVILMVGVNGAGKTTTIGKLAQKLTAEGHTCLLAAGDTFRAAAVQQLMIWGKRIGCEVVRGKDGSDPASVIFKAIEQARDTGVDVVLADTAGRLQTKKNLMVEMEKIAKTAGKALEGAPHETLLVLDATNGQNAISQAQEFKDVLNLSGIVLTKLDGTAKGGVVLGISDALRLPVRFIGLGERADDLHEFNARDFVEALLGGDDESAAN